MSTQDDYASALHGTSTDEYLQLIEIYHDDLLAPIRVVNDDSEYVIGLITYQPLRYRLKLPDDKKDQQPTANIIIDNIGRELTDWLEMSGGGRGALVRIMHVLRQDNGLPVAYIYYDITVRLDDVKVNVKQVQGQLGYRLLLQEAATKLTFRPETAPGLY